MNVKLFQKGVDKWSLVLEHELVRGLNTTEIKEFLDIVSRELIKTEKLIRGETDAITTKQYIPVDNVASDGAGNSGSNPTLDLSSKPPNTTKLSNDTATFLSECGLERCDDKVWRAKNITTK